MSGFALHLLRHGAPETPGLLLGRTDAVPTFGGIRACVDRQTGLAIDRLVASDLRRATLAGHAVGAQRNLPVAIDPRWRELDFGDWDGQAAATLDQAVLARFWDDPDANPPPGGERWSSLVARVGQAIGELAPRPTLVVTHGGAIRAALAHLCGFGQGQVWSFDLPYGALLSLTVWPGDRPAAQITGLRA